MRFIRTNKINQRQRLGTASSAVRATRLAVLNYNGPAILASVKPSILMLLARAELDIGAAIEGAAP